MSSLRAQEPRHLSMH